MLKNLKNFSLPEIEEKILKFWKEKKIFQKSLDQRRSTGRPFVFFEGPPTANGRPGLHHVLARSFKDIIPRYKTMQGFYVPRQAGWDTHGLPVEIEVEKELGIKKKAEIEEFGIAEFNSRAKDLIWKYRTDWEALTERMGYWIDMDHPYITYDNTYIESLWWIFSQVHQKGYLKKLLKTVPWCFRCQTPLSSHELGQPGAYKVTKDPAVYVKFRLESRKKNGNEYLLAWTTTPWTLPGNLAVAVNPKLTYTKYQVKQVASGTVEYLWSFNPPPEREGYDITVVEKMSGKKLVGKKYEPLFKLPAKTLKELSEHKLYEVYAGEFVATGEGSGLVHIAPSFGEDDFKLMGIKEGLPMTIDDSAKMEKGFPGEGKYIKQADVDITADLERRGLLYQSGTIEHEYPYCWRCGSPLVYIVRLAWFIEMSKLRDKMIAENKKINWVPAHVKEGRFGEWLKDLKDWAISRNRYWGTPLPIWECKKCEHHQVVGSLAELNRLSLGANTFYAVRHGQAEHNIPGMVASGPERGANISHLTGKGEEQIKETAKQLKKEKIQLIVSSPYERTRVTAKAIAKATGAKVIIDKRLSEINTGIFNWRIDKEYHKYFERPIDRFRKAPPGGETLTDVKVRMLAVISDLNRKYKNKRIAIVSHGDPLWVLEGALRGLSNEQILESGFYPVNEGFKKLGASNWPLNNEGELDLHRPFIDDIKLKCEKCKGEMTRVKEVADVWFDAGAMPFAGVHFPFALLKGDEKVTADRLKDLYQKIDFPADYISEGMDQTRGWFYTLLAISTLLDRGISYKNVICLGLILDKNGQKMSKSKGNVVAPMEMMAKYGADAVRWYFYTINDPGEPKRFNEDDLAKTVRKFILIVYNSFVFFDSYGKRSDKPSAKEEMTHPTHILDRWILARLNQLIENVTKKMESYQVGEAGRLIESFTDDMSRWYIRRSRDRFQEEVKGRAGGGNDWEEATRTLQMVLLNLSKLLAPFTPFFADAMYQSVGGKEESVHLDKWPEANTKLIHPELLKEVEELRQVATDALSLRAEIKLKVRQPLNSLTLKNTTLQNKDELLQLLKEEVNVKEIKFDSKLKAERGLELDTIITPELKEEGIVRDVIRTIQGLRQSAHYTMGEEVILMAEGSEEFLNLFQRNLIVIKKAVTARQIELKRSTKFDAELSTKVEGWDVWFAVRKI